MHGQWGRLASPGRIPRGQGWGGAGPEVLLFLLRLSPELDVPSNNTNVFLYACFISIHNATDPAEIQRLWTGVSMLSFDTMIRDLPELLQRLSRHDIRFIPTHVACAT